MHTEEPARIDPNLTRQVTSLHGKLSETVYSELVRTLGAQRLAFCKVERMAIQIHKLSTLANQVHLDSLQNRGIERVMVKPIQVKIRTQLGVCTTQQIQVECSRHAVAIVVGRM